MASNERNATSIRLNSTSKHWNEPDGMVFAKVAKAMLYSWQAKSRQTKRPPFEGRKLQQAELARLKRENTRLEGGVAFLKKAPEDNSTICYAS
jgi:hypothetical protein